MATSTDVDPGVDELFSRPLDEFIATRNALAARLRKDGDGEASARIKALAKPSVSAWAVNQLHRHRAALVEALQGAGEEMREAQREALAGKGGNRLRDATQAQRDAISKLVAAARELLEAGGHAATDTTLDRVGTTLQAIAAGGWPDGGAGRLARDLDPPGFDALSGLLSAAPAPARTRPAAAPSADRDEAAERRRREERAEAEATLAQARTRVKTARRDADRAEAAEERAAERAKASRRRADEAEREAEEARERAAAAEAAVAEAREEMKRAKSELTAAELEVTSAEQALENG